VGEKRGGRRNQSLNVNVDLRWDNGKFMGARRPLVTSSQRAKLGSFGKCEVLAADEKWVRLVIPDVPIRFPSMRVGLQRWWTEVFAALEHL